MEDPTLVHSDIEPSTVRYAPAWAGALCPCSWLGHRTSFQLRQLSLPAQYSEMSGTTTYSLTLYGYSEQVGGCPPGH
jgi:hypothetical protein